MATDMHGVQIATTIRDYYSIGVFVPPYRPIDPTSAYDFLFDAFRRILYIFRIPYFTNVPILFEMFDATLYQALKL